MADRKEPEKEVEDTACECNGTGLISGELCPTCHGHGSLEAYKRQLEADEAAKVPAKPSKSEAPA